MQFHLENAKARATQRLREGREKPIDLLARDLMLGDTFPVGDAPPYLIFDDMPLSEVNDIREEILEYQVPLATRPSLSTLCIHAFQMHP